MDSFTPEQDKQLKTWASERDTILSEIAVARDQNLILSLKNKNLSISITDIEDRIQQSVGRMKELDDREKLYEDIISEHLSILGSRKVKIESELSFLNKDLTSLKETKEALLKDIEVLQKIHDKVFARASVLDQVVDHVTRVNSKNIDDVNILIANLKEVLNTNK